MGLFSAEILAQLKATKLSKIRRHFDEIERMKESGVSYKTIAAMLRETGIDIADNELRAAISTIKKSATRKQSPTQKVTVLKSSTVSNTSAERKVAVPAEAVDTNGSTIMAFLKESSRTVADYSSDEIARMSRRQLSELRSREAIPDRSTNPILDKIDQQTRKENT